MKFFKSLVLEHGEDERVVIVRLAGQIGALAKCD